MDPIIYLLLGLAIFLVAFFFLFKAILEKQAGTSIIAWIRLNFNPLNIILFIMLFLLIIYTFGSIAGLESINKMTYFFSYLILAAAIYFAVMGAVNLPSLIKLIETPNSEARKLAPGLKTYTFFLVFGIVILLAMAYFLPNLAMCGTSTQSTGACAYIEAFAEKISSGLQAVGQQTMSMVGIGP